MNTIPTILLNQGNTASRRQAIQFTPVNNTVVPKYTKNNTHPFPAPGHSGSYMSFILSRNSAMNATWLAVKVHHPNVLIHAHMYEAKRPVGVSQRRCT